MQIAIGSDHGGYKLKEEIKRYLEKKGYTYKDFGCNSEESCDYPDYGFPVSEAVAKGEYDRGILICKTGIGMSIIANKVKGIRAALCNTSEIAKKSREHNDANVLVLAAVIDALKIVDVWLNTNFLGGRHKRRLDKIKMYEMSEVQPRSWRRRV